MRFFVFLEKNRFQTFKIRRIYQNRPRTRDLAFTWSWGKSDHFSFFWPKSHLRSLKRYFWWFFTKYAPTSSKCQIASSGPILVNPTDFKSLEPVFFKEKKNPHFCQFLQKIRHFEEKNIFLAKKLSFFEICPHFEQMPFFCFLRFWFKF